MNIINNPARQDWASLVGRNTPDDFEIEERVGDIVSAVERDGDAALRHFAREFDGAELSAIALSPEERKEAAAQVPQELKEAIAAAARNIAAFHAAELPRKVAVATQPGVNCLQRAVPIDSVGLYIPGGRAPLFSTVLMLGLPAKIAGCRQTVLCSPGGKDGTIAPAIVYAADVCGINEIYRIGGAQAIAAMAYGTETVKKVDKIFGPGNRYVTKAKQLVSRRVAIDMPAGPSEVLVMADHTAVPAFVAADMLSQAEHGPDSQAMLVCQNEKIASEVAQEVERQKALLARADSVEKSLSQSRIVVFPSREEMTDFANAYAPEHLIISMERPWELADKITAAGSVFIGNFSPESAGDYASGTNHTLPTGGWARSMSGVNMDSFMRKITYQEITPQGIFGLAPTITTMAQAEGLDAHAAAVRVRLDFLKDLGLDKGDVEDK